MFFDILNVLLLFLLGFIADANTKTTNLNRVQGLLGCYKPFKLI